MERLLRSSIAISIYKVFLYTVLFNKDNYGKIVNPN